MNLLEYENRPPICKLFVPEEIDYEGKEYYMDIKNDIYIKENFDKDSKCIGKMFKGVIYFNCNYDDDFVLK